MQTVPVISNESDIETNRPRQAASRFYDHGYKIAGCREANGKSQGKRPRNRDSLELRSVKDPRDPLTSIGVYRIPCSCGLVYIGTTKANINTRLKEHKRNCHLGQTDKSVLVEHVLQDGDDNIDFANTEALSTVSHYHTRLQREAIESYKRPGNFNRKEENLAINKIWYPVLRNALATGIAKRTAARQTTKHWMPSEHFDLAAEDVVCVYRSSKRNAHC
ncbi:hypothetical protein Trydic_g23934 [Trypoxylus dichotomus]